MEYPPTASSSGYSAPVTGENLSLKCESGFKYHLARQHAATRKRLRPDEKNEMPYALPLSLVGHTLQAVPIHIEKRISGKNAACVHTCGVINSPIYSSNLISTLAFTWLHCRQEYRDEASPAPIAVKGFWS